MATIAMVGTSMLLSRIYGQKCNACTLLLGLGVRDQKVATRDAARPIAPRWVMRDPWEVSIDATCPLLPWLGISDTCAEFQENNKEFVVESISLVANDIDVFYDEFIASSAKQLIVDTIIIKKLDIKGVDAPLNIIKCK